MALFLASGTLKANPMFAGVPGDLTLLSAAGVALAMLVRVHRDGLPHVPRAAALFGVLVGLMLLSVLWSPDPATGLRKVKTFETLTLLSFACPFVLFRTRAQVQRLMVVLVAVGLFVSLTAVRTGHQASPIVPREATRSSWRSRPASGCWPRWATCCSWAAARCGCSGSRPPRCSA